ncbi:MAG: 2-oxoglutarate dehydrogenase complex dihydrolipoyllysine-residue succinyltransferase [Firmicutes bacterium]|nr:2-oxoglutarate dehydrogenase complex dihydrolipoyllysine-residue succinyltransferase [Bacillota bacterium]
MAADRVPVVVPELGESVTEAVVGNWLKAVGEPVAAGEELVELETDKVNLTVTAETAGVLAAVLRQPGETVPVGAVLGEIALAGTGTPPEAIPPAPSAAPASPAPPLEETGPAAGRRASPAVRRLAEERGVDWRAVTPSGPEGRVRRADIPPAPAGPPRPARPDEERVPLSRRRLTIARRLVEARNTAAMLTTFNEVDLAAVTALRQRHREAFRERYGVSLGFMSFFTRAVVSALKRFPRLNAELDGNDLILKRHYDIGIAVATDEGLVVPVVRDADRLSFWEVEGRIADLAARARNGSLRPDDLEGGTFTITNGGVFGSLFSTPILNGPQVGILGMHRIQERPVAVEGQVVIRPMMYVALTYDHRVVDGQEAVSFLVHVKTLLEDPERLLVEG